MIISIKNDKARGGFTLSEVLISVGIFSLVMVAALSAFSMAGRRTKSGTDQIMFNNMARVAQHRISRLIEDGKTVALESNYLAITTIDFKTAALVFEDADGDPDTRANNVIAYYGILNDPTTRVVICTHVAPVDDNPIFRIVPSSPVSAQLTFLIGHAGVTRASLGAGQVAPGVEVRMSSTPRNRQRWYD